MSSFKNFEKECNEDVIYAARGGGGEHRSSVSMTVEDKNGDGHSTIEHWNDAASIT